MQPNTGLQCPRTMAHARTCPPIVGPARRAPRSRVVHLLETLVDEHCETLSPAEAKAIAEACEWSAGNPPIPHDEVLAEFGVSAADWEKMSREP